MYGVSPTVGRLVEHAPLRVWSVVAAESAGRGEKPGWFVAEIYDLADSDGSIFP